MIPPLTDWEDELGRLVAHRMRIRATRALDAGEWAATDFEDAIEAGERRLTARQRELLWEALTADADLGAAARSARGGDSTRI
jgi:hypothetical protein